MVMLPLVGASWLAMAGHALADASLSPLGEIMGMSKKVSDSAMAAPDPSKLFSRISVVAKDLRGPDGIARDLETGDLYVSEEDAATIVRIKPNGSKQVLFDATTPLHEEGGGTRKSVAGLRSPEGLSLDGKGTLYAVEDVPGGRLIAFNVKEASAKTRLGGKVVPLPFEKSRFAWESVDARPTGELLLAGSTMEAVLGEAGREGPFSIYRGAILYRDVHGEWWMPLGPPMVSYSAVCFSSDGNFAFFACESSGDVGCMDLRSHSLRTYRASHVFRSPEGLGAMPGGAVLVAEEGGKIYRLDPTADTIQLLYDNERTVESVHWDDARRRLLVTDDQQGALVSLELKAGMDFRSSHGTVEDIPFEERSTPVEMIPDRCPKYLAKVLKLGGYDPNEEGGKVSFRDFARKYCLIAIDADAKLISSDPEVEDPIRQIQFVVVAPYLIGIQEGELIWSSSGFTAVKASGQVVKTELVQRQVIQGDLMESRFTPVGGQTIALPMPFSARINTDGTTSVNFMGMGVTPDFYMVLNTVEPDQSVMVVMQPDRTPQQYQLQLPPRRTHTHWVVALERKEPDVWRRLAFPP